MISTGLTDFKRVVSPVMADIWNQIIPAIEQKKTEPRKLVPLGGREGGREEKEEEG
jgi:hypothetical protein